MQKRPDRPTYFMTIAKLVALRSTCSRAHVGAVLVSNNRIVATGYNGAPPGGIHCIDHGCLMHNNHCIRTIHAEQNALLNLEHKYDSLTLYCTHQPCWNCYKSLLVAGVKEINYLTPYDSPEREAGIFDLLASNKEIVPLMNLYIGEIL